MRKIGFSFKTNLILGFGLSIGVGILVVTTVLILFISTGSVQREIVALTNFRDLVSQEQVHILRYVSGESESLGDYSSLHQKFLSESKKLEIFQQSPRLQLIAEEENKLASILLSSKDELGVLDSWAIANIQFNEGFMQRGTTKIPTAALENLLSQRVIVDAFDPTLRGRDEVIDTFREASKEILDVASEIEGGEELANSQRMMRDNAEDIFASRIQLTDDVLPRYAKLVADIDGFLTDLSTSSTQRGNMIFLAIVIMILISIFIETIIAVVSVRYASNIKEQLEMQNRAIKRFTRVVTHELRTPLTIIRGFAEQIRENVKGETKEEVDIIKNTAENLIDLISNLLDISKIEAGKMEIKREAFKVRGAIKEVSKKISYIAEQKGLKIITKIDKGVGEVHSDKGKFEQILINLVNNAIKFTKKGSITIWARVDEENLVVDVIDTGIGIKKESLRKLFQEFEQVSDASIKKQQGSGLGLSISKQLVNILGGKLSVKSTYGKGSTFTLILPLKHKTKA